LGYPEYEKERSLLELTAYSPHPRKTLNYILLPPNPNLNDQRSALPTNPFASQKSRAKKERSKKKRHQRKEESGNGVRSGIWRGVHCEKKLKKRITTITLNLVINVCGDMVASGSGERRGKNSGSHEEKKKRKIRWTQWHRMQGLLGEANRENHV